MKDSKKTRVLLLRLRQHCITPLKDNISSQGGGCLGHQELASAVSQAETATRQASPEDWRAKDIMAKVHQSIQVVASIAEHMATSMSSASDEDPMTTVLFRMSKDRRPANTVTCPFKEQALVTSSPSLFTYPVCRNSGYGLLDTAGASTPSLSACPKKGTKIDCQYSQG